MPKPSIHRCSAGSLQHLMLYGLFIIGCTGVAAQEVVARTGGYQDTRVAEMVVERRMLVGADAISILETLGSLELLLLDEVNGGIRSLLQGCASFEKIVYRFDLDGNLVEWTSLDATGAEREWGGYSYQGGRLRDVERSFRGILKIRQELAYIGESVYVTETAYSLDDWVGNKVIARYSRETQTYDRAGSLTTVEDRLSDGSLEMSRTVTVQRFALDGTIRSTTVYLLNDQYELQEWRGMDQAGAVTKKLQYLYEPHPGEEWKTRRILVWQARDGGEEARLYLVETRSFVHR